MNICVKGYVESFFMNVNDALPILCEETTNVPEDYYNLKKEQRRTLKRLLDFLKDEGYSFYGNIDVGVNVSPVANKTINLLNTSSFLLSQSLRVELPNYTYLVSPFLKNEDILQEFKKSLFMQVCTAYYIPGCGADSAEFFLSASEGLDSIADDLIQYLLKEEEKREFTISESIPLDICFMELTILSGDKPFPYEMRETLEESTGRSFNGSVKLNFSIPIITQSFEPFKVITLNAKEAVTHLGQRVLSMGQVLTAPTDIFTLETKNEKEKSTLKVIGSNDFLSFQV